MFDDFSISATLQMLFLSIQDRENPNSLTTSWSVKERVAY
jgi:hypothetical protein